MRIPFGKPFPAIDSTSLRAGTAAGLVNGYINELDDYPMVPGHTVFATHSGSLPIDSKYETLNGTILAVTGGVVVRVDSSGTFTPLTGDTVTAGAYCYWAEDNQQVILAHGGKLARIDLVNLTVTLMNQNTPSDVTHVVREKGYLLCNGNEPLMAASVFDLGQVFDTSPSMEAVVILYDKPGWIVATAQGPTTTDGGCSRIYLSRDNGITWMKVHTEPWNGVIGTENVFMPALEYMGGGVVLAGTAQTTGKILRSTDYGETWTDLGQMGSSNSINFIRKITDQVVIAGGGNGPGLGRLFRSANAGAAWSDVGTAFGEQLTAGEAMIADGSIVCISVIAAFDVFTSEAIIRVWRSTNTASTFAMSAMSFDGADYTTFIQRITDSVSIMSNGWTTLGTDQKIWRSEDVGVTWADIGPIPDFNDAALPFAACVMADGSALIGTAGNNLAVGGAQIWKSIDEGITWFLVTVLDDNKEAGIAPWGLKETHIPGTIIATGRIGLEHDGTTPAAKWQTAVGKNALSYQSVFYSEDIGNQYEAVNSWEFFNPQSSPDNCTGLFGNRGLVYAGGPRSIEVNYSSQDPEFPWAVSDPALPYGLGAPFSWANFDDINTVMYLSCTDKIWEVVKFQGRIQQSISQVYSAILNERTLITSPETAKAWGMTMRGIPMYVLTFQADNLTICYNLLKDHWFRWGYWNGSAYQAALINSYCYSRTLRKHLVGDRRATGKIFELAGLADDSGDMRWELTSGNVGDWTVTPAGRMVFKCKRGAVTDTSEPNLVWQHRDNGNQNFSTGRNVSLGLQNDSELFGSLNRCGVYQVRQHRIVYTGQKTDFIFAGADES